MKRIAIIPTLCTLGNGVCGFASILCAARVNLAANLPVEWAYYISGWLILAAMVFDMLDGYLARRVRTTSQFGAELDSLCDVISFGIAPAFLLIRLGASFEGRLSRDLFFVVATLYLICVVLRLARFNAQTNLEAKSQRMFRGLPSPAAAGCIATLVVARYTIADPKMVPDETINPLIPWVAPLCASAVSLLMVSRVPYVHLTERLLHRRQNFSRLVQVVVAVFAIILFRELALVVMFWLYAIAGPVQLLLNRRQAGATQLAVTGGPLDSSSARR
jgi:CDP-diacylglycerol--serine O-phosphatidyltransferase